MNSLVLEMPMVTVANPGDNQMRDTRLQERLKSLHRQALQELKQQYHIVDEERVFTFLHNHSHLIPMLNEGREAVSLYFGEETPILLTQRRDPEVGLEHLIAWIQTNLSADEAVARWLELSDAWYLDRLETLGDLLNFNLGGRP